MRIVASSIRNDQIWVIVWMSLSQYLHRFDHKIKFTVFMMQGFVSLEGDFVWGHVKNMGVEILGSDHTKGQTISIMANADGDWAQTIGSNNIKQFSAPTAAEDSKPAFPGVPNGSLKVDNGVPKDVKDEWPTPKEIHTFYYVKFRSYEDL